MEKTSYDHGTPSWVDLATPDPEQARAFYGGLFGWEFEQEDADEPGRDYVMCTKAGKPVAGMMQLSPEMAAGGMPPVWTTYITVDDLDATVARIAAAGGQVMQPPMDVMDAGRMSVLASPSGAVVAMWEAKEHIGAHLVNEDDTLCWNELITDQLDADLAFFADVLGWKAIEFPGMDGYRVLALDDAGRQGVGGAMAPPMSEMPNHWVVYFAVDDCDAKVAEATELGGTTVAGPMDIAVGRTATLIDPTGGVFAIITMKPTDDDAG